MSAPKSPPTTGSSTPTVAYLGPEGTFTHLAAKRYFGATGAFAACPSIPAVFEAVVSGRATRGVVPIENSIEGGVSFTLEALLETSLSVCGETVLEVEHCLLSHAVQLESIETVLSHPQGLAQCRNWLAANLPSAALSPTLSTAKAALDAATNPTAAAIASSLAGELAGLPLLARGIQDRKSNGTRFVVLSGDSASATGTDKTSIVFATPHQQGALVRALALFDQAGINLTRIESRPRPGQRWHYVFFVDLEGHQRDPDVSSALEALRHDSDYVKVLGSYPRSST